MKITLVKKITRKFAEHEKRMAAYVLFEGIDGLNEQDSKAWRRFINFTMRLEAGEMTTIDVRSARVPAFHRRHMKLESLVFKAQEAFETFDAFRDWLKAGSAFVEWHARDGELTAVPRSMSWEEMDDEVEFRHVHDNMVAFLKTERACSRLWPHLSPRGGLEMIHGIMTRMSE